MPHSFGEALRQLRKTTPDPQKGGVLTQARLAELISRYLALNSSWPHPQTISDWERGRDQLDAWRDRNVLLVIAKIFAEFDALNDAAAVDTFFAAGGYAPLSPPEQADIFGHAATPFPPKSSATAGASLRHRLPPPTYTHLVGVAETIARLTTVLRAPHPPWLISIEGLGGIGKTTLADHLLRTAITDGATDTFAWVSARQEIFSPVAGLQSTGTPALTPAGLVDDLLKQLDAQAALALPPPERLTALSRRLRDVPFLFVVDNLETAVDYETILPTLRALANPGKFILTSRRSLQAHPDVYCLNLTELAPAAALQLIRQEAALRGVSALASASDAQLTDIYATVGGNPLALKLVIGQITLLSLPTVLHNLRQAQGKKIDELYTFIYWQAWHALSPHGQQVLLTMPLAQGGTFAQVMALSRLDSDITTRALEELATLSLVQVGGELDERRYTIHRLTETFLLNEALKWQQ